MHSKLVTARTDFDAQGACFPLCHGVRSQSCVMRVACTRIPRVDTVLLLPPLLPQVLDAG